MIQLQVLNKILATKDFGIIIYNNIDSDYFSEYTTEFKFIKAHQDTYNQVPDYETFLASFPNFDVINVTEGWEYLITELVKDCNTRKLANVFNKVRDLINRGDTEGAFNLYTQNADLGVKAKKLEYTDITKDVSRYEKYVEKGSAFDKFFISTGFKELDDIVGGWDVHEELATIVARPNVGKSFILLRCALAAVEQGLRVGLYSGEMSTDKVGFRFDTLVSHIPNTSINKGNLDVNVTYRQFIDKLPTMYSGSLFVLEPKDIGGSATVTALRAFIEKAELDVLFIDQLTLLDDQRHAKNPIEKLSNISRDLKNLQVLIQKPIISVTQQNRADTEEHGVSLSNIGGSDRIGQDSTIVIFLEKKDDVLKVQLVKSRDSANFKTLSYRTDFNLGTFMYIDESSGQEAVNNLATDLPERETNVF